ncbi:protein Wiz-like isoform X1 [Cyprinus carpio]|uniref:Protein Wiz-like isoform X1 n=1 Tax=Cyprinus carpio TaxID=7962 RepID=A0A9Q9W2F8_CYPCA|nr:protein Wiz-like isoform X1 [Cyprinus carpio]XP_042575602.1 protein Wiz-like isoform X1 [Cyprinus carpio]
MEPEEDISTTDPQDLMSSQGLLPSTSTSLLNCTFLGGLLHCDDMDKGDGNGDLDGPKCFFPTLEHCGKVQRSPRSSAFPSSLTWDSDSEKETLDEEELQHFSNPHGLAAHSPGSPTSGQQEDRFDIDLCQEPVETKHLFLEKIPPTSLEVKNQGDVTYKEMKTTDSSLPKLDQDKVSHLPDTTPEEGCQKDKKEEQKMLNSRGREEKITKEPDVYTFPGDSEPESPPPGPWAHCTFIQRRRKKRAILRPFSGLDTWQHTTVAGRKTRGKPLGAKERRKTTKVGEGMFKFKEEKEEKVRGRQRSVVEHQLDGDLSQEIFTCVECSIYFRKRIHLHEHMQEHGQVGRSGKKWQCREKDSWSGHLNKKAFECIECGLEFVDKVLLLDHQRCHEESRQKILEEIGKLKEGDKRVAEQASCSKASEPVNQESTDVSQFVCLKCNFSSDLPQELAEHAKTHNTRTRAGVYRTSPRFQQKSCKKGPVQSSADVTSTLVTSPFNKRYPIRASKKSKETQPKSGASQVDFSSLSCQSTSATPGEATEQPDNTTLRENTDPVEELRQTEEPRALVDNPVEENVPQPQHLTSSPPNPRAAPQRKDVAFKSIGNKRSVRATRGKLGRTRASTRLDPKSTLNPVMKKQVQISNQSEDKCQKEDILTPEPEHDPKQDSKIDSVEVPALAFQLKSSFSASLRGAAERLGLLEGQQAQLRNELPLILIESLSSDLQIPLLCSRVMETEPTANDPDPKANSSSPKKNSKKLEAQEEEPKLKEDKSEEKSGEDTLVAAKLEDDDIDDDEDEEDVVSRLIDALAEEDDEDDDGEGLLKSVERKCPYCPDRFHNGIGLANHVRGHLNRVGVSYNVRHFISPEEVNAIEKKFSYQKKKKKVANFDPSTFSVMRCEFCSAGFDTRAGLSSHARAHLRDFGITNWEVTVSPINILRELFAKHPDLVLPTAPTHTLQSSEEQNSDEEQECRKDMKDEENMTAEPTTLSSDSPKRCWKEEHNISELEDGEEAEDGEEEEEEAQMPVTDKLAASPEEKTMFSIEEQSPESKETDTMGSNLLKCEFCGAAFETRRGLSSHARSHLRQLGIGMSENSGAPIDLLYQITKERSIDTHFTGTSPTVESPKKLQHHAPIVPIPSPSPTKDLETEEGLLDTKPPVPFSIASSAIKVSSSPTTHSAAGSLPSSPFVKSRSPSPVLRKAPISSLLPVSSPLRSQEHKTLGKNQSTNLSSPNKPFWAPQDTDAPLNLTMDMDSKDIICQLCGAWFETRKGLSSHARAHLRHFGIEYSESKGSPIDLLNRFILTDDFKHRANTFLSDGPEDLRSQKTSMTSLLPSTSTSPKRSLPSSPVLYKTSTSSLRTTIGSKATSTSTHPLLGPPPKKLKASSLQVLRFSSGEVMSFPIEPMKDVGCEFCGELFENRKGLSSHARSHLRQLGITEWSVNGSPIDTLKEIIVRRGLPSIIPLKSPKSPSSSPIPGLSRTAVQSSTPPGNVLGRLPFHFAQTPSHDQPTTRKMSPSTSTASSSPNVELVKPKPEPEIVEVTMKGSDMGVNESYNPEPLHSSLNTSDNVYPVNLVMTQEKEPSRDIRCEFCGEFFENRKGLSSHARSHLRHMGITEWSVNGSPIDTLWEVMRRQGTTPASVALAIKEEPGQDGGISLNSPGYQSSALSRKSPLNLLHSGSRLHKHGLGSVALSSTSPVGKIFGVPPLKKKVLVEEGQPGEKALLIQSKNFSPPPQDYSFRGKTSVEKPGVGHMDASCELCGFYFENRKALASHARAHLRQFGVTEWCVNGSPIETLSAWIRSRPQKAAEMQQSYVQGARYAQKKRYSSALSPSCDSDSTTPVSQKPAVAKWASLTLPQKRAIGRDVNSCSWGLSSRGTDAKSRSGSSTQHGLIPQPGTHHSNNALPHAQVAHSELNVRLPRGFERRPLKHPSHAEGGEGESGAPKPRSSTVPALVPKPPSTPLVRLVGKIYSLKCRFCDVEFHGPLSVQEDWIRHLQQHILNLNYNKTASPANDTPAQSDTPDPKPLVSAATSTSSTTTAPSTTVHSLPKAHNYGNISLHTYTRPQPSLRGAAGHSRASSFSC